jgi:acetyl esterase/lipase
MDSSAFGERNASAHCAPPQTVIRWTPMGMPSRRFAIVLFASSVLASAADPQWIALWPAGAPGSEGKTTEETVRTTPQGEHVTANVHHPSIGVFLPSKATATGAAVIIAPGGGHSELWADHEGVNVATWLADHGVAGFVLKYRLAREKGSTYKIEGESLADMQRAIRLVRSRAAGWGVDPERVGVMGFSAGGEIAALAATRFGSATPDAADPIDRLSAKPAFQALLYPAIPRDMPLSKETPPAFLACGENDRQNISQGLPELYLAIKRAGANAELHVYTGVGHGFGLRPTTKGAVAGWPSRFLEFLEARKLATPK